MDRKELKKAFEKSAEKWDASAVFAYFDPEGTDVFKAGYADRKGKRKLKKSDTVIIPLESRFFTCLALVKLIEEGRLSLNRKLSDYIPECVHADKITVRDILRGESGLPDYFYGGIILSLQDDEEFKTLSDKEKVKKEAKLSYNRHELSEVLDIVNGKDLNYIPGSVHNSSSQTDWFFARCIAEKLTGKTLLDYLNEILFTPIGMKPSVGNAASTVPTLCPNDDKFVPTDNEGAEYECITIGINDAIKLAQALVSKDERVLSAGTWDKAFATSYSKSLLTWRSNGTHEVYMGISGYSLDIFFEPEISTGWLIMTPEEPVYKEISGRWEYYFTAVQDHIYSAITYPVSPVFSRVNSDTVFDAMDIKINEDQTYFVDSARDSIAWTAADPVRLKPMVLTEHGRAVALAVLKVDRQKKNYAVEIIQVDKLYQHRGYGKILMREVMKYLKAQGAEKLTIGVARNNEVAIKLYKSVGFTEKEVYRGGYNLEMTL
ncbi:MAG: GNAT family N-acetyltransferase [Eubacteriaceae bacterium]|nr:GNAT family N-acetyltransferase [Eubacteriaceae bacterium]